MADLWVLVFLFRGASIAAAGYTMDAGFCERELKAVPYEHTACINTRNPTRRIYRTGPNEAEVNWRKRTHPTVSPEATTQELIEQLEFEANDMRIQLMDKDAYIATLHEKLGYPKGLQHP